MVELKVPTVGESITEVQIGDWLKGEGEFVEKDQPLVEIESDKATVELPAPSAGKISKVIKRKGERANVGEVIGHLDESAQKSVAPSTAKGPSEKPAEDGKKTAVAEKASAELAG